LILTRSLMVRIALRRVRIRSRRRPVRAAPRTPNGVAVGLQRVPEGSWTVSNIVSESRKPDLLPRDAIRERNRQAVYSLMNRLAGAARLAIELVADSVVPDPLHAT
jgi:hypothetical protein